MGGKAMNTGNNDTTQSKKNYNGTATPVTQHTVKRVFGVVVPLCFAAFFISALIISVANDMYAFVKPDKEITLEINHDSVRELSGKLEESGVINNPHIFEFYIRSKNLQNSLENISGSFTLNPSMSYRTIILEITG